MSMVMRQQATLATLARFRDKPFDWATRATCVHLAHFQASGMGHSLPPITPFRTASGAVRALRRQGHETFAALLDDHFERIAPARMLLGDLAMLPGEAPFGAVMVFDGMGKLLGWHEGDPTRIVPVARAIEHVTAAWRL